MKVIGRSFSSVFSMLGTQRSKIVGETTEPLNSTVHLNSLEVNSSERIKSHGRWYPLSENLSHDQGHKTSV